jgi:predicted N-acetyltransferase YhbS
VAELEIRPATDDDLPAVLALLRESMGRADDPRFEALFRWKHLDNAFGRSPMWVACDGGTVAGFRVFMRWEFESGDRVWRAVRAVDTATHPDYQGRGIFTRLTLAALDAVAAEGVDFVFNTPNDQSRPGYLKMGWRELGRPRASFRPVTLARLGALRGARTAAQHWSEPVRAGTAAPEFLAGDAPVARLLAARGAPPPSVLRTRLSPAVLRWRFGLAELAYRAVGDGPDGVAFVRVRRRGPAREAAVALVLAPGGRRGASRVLARTRRALRGEADYLLAIGAAPGFVPLRALGPIVTVRALQAEPPAAPEGFAFTLGDLELF